MSYISNKKRSNNFVLPTVILAAGITELATQATPVSADTVQNGSVASSGNTTTGWDTAGSNSATMSDASNTLSSATSDITSAADSKASSVTSAAPSVSASTSVGWVDVYVDHSKMDDAITNAAAQGVNVVHDPTVIQTGDASATAKNTSSAASYYASQAASITSVANKYTTDMANYNATVDKNKSDAAGANAEQDALRSNLAAQGQTTNMVSKQYSASAVASDTAAIKASIADGKTLINAKTAIDNANTEQNSMTLFTTAAAQGHVKLAHKTVTVASKADADKYTADLETQYANLQKYLNALPNQNGSIPDADKPTYTLYNFTIDPTVQAKGTAPVVTYHYTAVPVTKPVTPSVNYHIYDIRSQPTNNSGYDNKDGEDIPVDSNANAGGNKVAQAMVNQTIGLDTDNQPLPSDRFDKIQDLTIITKMSKDATFDLAASNTDPSNWTVTYDEATNTVTQTATPAYLVQVNLNQNTNNSGTVGGTTAGEWAYKAPKVFFKLTKDDTTYQASSTTIVNKEYMFVGQGVQIRTDSADPTKVNENSKYQDIDGKAVLPGSINNYVLGWDFNQYKNVNIDSEMQKNGLKLVDDFPEDAVDVTGPISVVDPATGQVLYSSDVPAGATVGSTGTFKGADGKAVDGFTWTIIDKTNAPDNLKDVIKGSALMISYTGKDNAFYKTYVEGGHSLNVVMPMTTKKIDNTPDKQGGTYNGNSYENVAYQSDFGNTYKSNTVTNTAPTIDPKKDAVLSFSNLTSLDINNNPTAEIQNGTSFEYRLGGSKLPTNLSEDINSYKLVDEMPTDSDEYDGEFILQTNSAIFFKTGSTLAKRYPNGIPANSDISKYVTQSIERNVSGSNGATATGTTNGADTKVNKVTFSVDGDFLDQIDYSKTNFHVDAFVTAKRIANNQNVKNVFSEIINNVDYGSNEIETNSKPNALDILNDKLNSLESSASAGISSNGSAIDSMAGALSVIVSKVTSLSTATSSAVSSLASDNSSVASQATSNASQAESMFDYTNQQISLVAKSANSATSSVASSASSAIASNSTAIGSVASDVTSQVSSVASATNKVISSLAAKLAASTEQALSTLTIYDSSVKNDAEALQYAVNHGVATGAIKSIKVNDAGKYVVTYNTSKTGINNSTAATTNGSGADTTTSTTTATTAKKTMTFAFYTLKTQSDVYAKLATMGYAKTDVVSLTSKNGVFTAIVNAK